MQWYVIGVAVLFGLALGSFANVVIYRVPLNLSIVSPPSACPGCDTPILRRHNVPVLGWLVLRGKCAHCGMAISPRYPAIELAMGVLFGLIVWGYGLTWTTGLLVVGAFAAVVLSAIDVAVRRLPVAIVYPWAAVTAVIIAAAVIDSGDVWLGARAAIGAASLWAFYLGAKLAYPRGLGMGDVRIAPVIGAVLAYAGWAPLVVGAFSAFVWGLLGALGPMIKARAVSGVKIPFGPWMFAGAATGIVVGEPIARWYLHSVVGI